MMSNFVQGGKSSFQPSLYYKIHKELASNVSYKSINVWNMTIFNKEDFEEIKAISDRVSQISTFKDSVVEKIVNEITETKKSFEAEEKELSDRLDKILSRAKKHE